MGLLAKRSEIKEDKSNIITLGVIAKQEKIKDSSVINSTIGMLYDEEGNLFTFDSVNKTINNLTADEKFEYSSTPGHAKFHEAVKRWVFQDNYDEMTSVFHVEVMATPGGSGALSNTFSNYLNPGEKALLPSIMWGNYKQFLYESGSSYDCYNLFNDKDEFNIEHLKEMVYKHKKEQNRVLLVINDPCHNPTGYCMKDDEWDQVIDLLNEVSADGCNVILMLDMAYIDYDLRGLENSRNTIMKFRRFNDNILTVLGFSGSKTMALYGLRIGAMIGLSKNEKDIKDFAVANKFSSRAKWSNSSMLGINIITKIILDEELKNSFKNELEQARLTLISRAKAFIEEADKVGLKYLPFDCGFFITIPCDDPDAVYKRLVEKKVHLIPMGNIIRATLSSISLEECKKLPKIIKECL
jgi:aspartate/tyrosine/aromatic aminotransferase